VLGINLWRRPTLVYPIPPAPRTAVLVAGFRSRGRVRVFARGWCDRAREFAPQAVAGTLSQIEELARAGVSLSHAVIVLGRPADPRLTDADRERLWDAFHVPAFEQIIGGDCKLLAAECEAHDGLHVESPLFAPDPDQIDRNPCACGRTAPRLSSPEPIEQVRGATMHAR